MKAEKVVERAVVRWAREHNILVLKLNVQGNRAWPDCIFFILGGKPSLIEFKRPRQRARPLQAHIMGLLTELGYDVSVAETKEEAIKWLEKQIAHATHVSASRS